MKILNLYSGIGGNRKLWGDEHQITAIEYVPEIAKIYKDLFPNDNVIITDAHEYLLKHYKEFDFIWASPPCPTHSRARYGLGFHGGKVEGVYPDMRLYQEIIFLKHHFRGKWCVENVMSYYQPLITPDIIGRHYYWTNFRMGTNIKIDPTNITAQSKKYPGRTGVLRASNTEDFEKRFGYDLSKYQIRNKRLLLRNCVEPEIVLHILMESIRENKSLFD